MRLKEFLKDRLLFILWNALIAAFSAVLFFVVDAKVFFVLFVPCLYIFGCAAVLAVEFIRKNSYYKKLYYNLDELDRKCLLSEIIEEPNFYEGKMLYDILKTSNKAMNDEIAGHSRSSAEYREYIEMWVHEVKTPIAGAKLIGENNGNDALLEALERIDKYVEQALFYSRSNTVEKDFIIRKTDLKEMVAATLRKNAKHIIGSKVNIELTDIDGMVYTDAKWVDFILWQLLDNAIKYESKNIKIYSEQNQNNITLFICDDGIGIQASELGRIFDKGFTGENGRRYAKSTGIGLYLCKKLCLKLGLNITVRSTQNEGTTFEIVFPKSEMHGI